MRVAFYKARTSGGSGNHVLDTLISWWTRSPYSHVEAILGSHKVEGQEVATCGSSSPRDGGVRIKVITLDPARWDIVDCPEADEATATKWFSKHEGKGYDYLGLFGFVFRPATEGENDRFFCSEAVASAIGIPDPWAFSPGQLYDVLKFRSKG